MHSDDEQFEGFLIDVLDRLSKSIEQRDGLTKSYSAYQEANPGADRETWYKNAFGEVLKLEILRERFLAYFSNGDLDGFISAQSCLQYLQPDFQKYAYDLSECLQKGLDFLKGETIQPAVGSSKKGLQLDYERHQICIDGTWYDLTEEQTIMWSLLLEADGKWTPGESLHDNAAKVKYQMPDPVKAEIEGDRHNGYRLKRLAHA
jgi:hypothetical protein